MQRGQVLGRGLHQRPASGFHAPAVSLRGLRQAYVGGLLASPPFNAQSVARCPTVRRSQPAVFVTRFKDDRSEGATATVQAPTALGALRVNFELQKQCRYGEAWGVCGSAEELGAWNPTRAVPLQWSPGDTWCAHVALPKSTHLEWKYVLLDDRTKAFKAWVQDVCGQGNLTLDVDVGNMVTTGGATTNVCDMEQCPPAPSLLETVLAGAAPAPRAAPPLPSITADANLLQGVGAVLAAGAPGFPYGGPEPAEGLVPLTDVPHAGLGASVKERARAATDKLKQTLRPLVDTVSATLGQATGHEQAPCPGPGPHDQQQADTHKGTNPTSTTPAPPTLSSDAVQVDDDAADPANQMVMTPHQMRQPHVVRHIVHDSLTTDTLAAQERGAAPGTPVDLSQLAYLDQSSLHYRAPHTLSGRMGGQGTATPPAGSLVDSAPHTLSGLLAGLGAAAPPAGSHSPADSGEIITGERALEVLRGTDARLPPPGGNGTAAAGGAAGVSTGSLRTVGGGVGGGVGGAVGGAVADEDMRALEWAVTVAPHEGGLAPVGTGPDRAAGAVTGEAVPGVVAAGGASVGSEPPGVVVPDAPAGDRFAGVEDAPNDEDEPVPRLPMPLPAWVSPGGAGPDAPAPGVVAPGFVAPAAPVAAPMTGGYGDMDALPYDDEEPRAHASALSPRGLAATLTQPARNLMHKVSAFMHNVVDQPRWDTGPEYPYVPLTDGTPLATSPEAIEAPVQTSWANVPDTGYSAAIEPHPSATYMTQGTQPTPTAPGDGSRTNPNTSDDPASAPESGTVRHQEGAGQGAGTSEQKRDAGQAATTTPGDAGQASPSTPTPGSEEDWASAPESGTVRDTHRI